MILEYKLVEREKEHELSEWDLNQLGAKGWALVAVFATVVEGVDTFSYHLSRNNSRKKIDIFLYHFAREKKS